MQQILHLQKSLQKAAQYISRTQQYDGSFPSESKNICTKTTKLHTTIFFNAEALYLLGQINGINELHQAKHRLAQFILSQKAPDGSFNYWCKASEKQSIPNDIDDTACAILALIENLPTSVAARLLPPFINLVKKQNDNGKINTWFTKGAYKNDYDIIVQLNVKAALKSLGICFPVHNPNQYLLKNWHSKSRYYVDIFYCSYLASRSSTVFDQSPLIRELAHPTNPWQLAISLTVLKQKPTTQHVEFLLKSQHSDGSWQGQIVVLEGFTSKEKQTFSSSKVLATLFIINIFQNHLIYNEDIRLARLLSSVNTGPPPKPGTLNFYLVTIPLLIFRHSTKTQRFTDYRSLATASLSGLYGLQWLNAVIDKKFHAVADNNTSAESLIRFITYYLSKTSPRDFKRFLVSSLFHQFIPPENSSYLLQYRSTYEKRIRIAYAISETMINDCGAVFSRQFKQLLELTFVIRSISDDIHDLNSDIKNNNATGTVALAKDYGLKAAVLLSYARIIRLTEKVQKDFFTKTDLTPYEYHTMRVLKRSYVRAKEAYLSEKIARALRLS